MLPAEHHFLHSLLWKTLFTEPFTASYEFELFQYFRSQHYNLIEWWMAVLQGMSTSNFDLGLLFP